LNNLTRPVVANEAIGFKNTTPVLLAGPVTTTESQNRTTIINKMTDYANCNASPIPTGYCGTFVRKSIEHGLGKTIGSTAHAKDFGPILLNNGFKQMPANTAPTVGDIVIFGGTKKSKSGHIAILTKTC
jgi:hypothetical protein